MPEIQILTLTHKEIVEALIKNQGIHEGIWELYMEFGIGGANIMSGPDQADPAAIVPIKKIGIHKVDKDSPLSVDASKVNPA